MPKLEARCEQNIEGCDCMADPGWLRKWQHNRNLERLSAPKPLVHTARFIGRDSLGYINGDIYQLIISYGLYKGKGHLWIERWDGSQKCPYSSREKLLENWEIIEPKEIFGVVSSDTKETDKP